MSDKLEVEEFLSGFLMEAEEHLAAANKNLLAADALQKANQLPARQVRELFRALHTLKGLAAMVGTDPIVDLAHEMEAVLRDADRRGGALPKGAVDVLFQGVRAMEERVAQLGRGAEVSPAPAALVEALARLREDAPAEGGREAVLSLDAALLGKLSAGERTQLSQGAFRGLHILRVEFQPTPERMEKGVNITSVRERLSALGEIVKVVPQSRPPPEGGAPTLTFTLLFLTQTSAEEVARAAELAAEDVQDVPVSVPAPGPAQALPQEEEPAEEATTTKGLVRVDVARLDDALDKLSALVTTRLRMTRALKTLADRGQDVRELSAIVLDQARQLRDLRGAIMAARMVPVRDILQRVPLIVRGLSRSTGKRVRLDLRLGQAELDKSVGERLFPAVVHLVRNGVDHGLETPDERVRAGKPAEGTLVVECLPRSNSQLELRIEDDGRGIDPEAVARKAEVPVPKDDAAILALISRPGLSTRAQADKTSGRGMGMDIVRKVVEAQLGGELELQNQPGRGTTFILRVPLSITIIDAFTFEVGEERYAVPVSSVEEIMEVEERLLVDAPRPRAGQSGQGPTHRLLERRGEALALVGLEAVLGRPQTEGSSRKALVIRKDGAPVAFGVSRMLGQQEVVVRPLEDPLVRVAGVSGATDLGDGRPTLVLDLVALAGGGRAA